MTSFEPMSVQNGGSASGYPAGFASRAPGHDPSAQAARPYFYAVSGLWLTSAIAALRYVCGGPPAGEPREQIPGSELLASRSTPRTLTTEGDRVTATEPRPEPPFWSASVPSVSARCSVQNWPIGRTPVDAPAGRTVRVCSVRLVSFSHRPVAAICHEVEPVDGPARITVQSELTANE